MWTQPMLKPDTEKTYLLEVSTKDNTEAQSNSCEQACDLLKALKHCCWDGDGDKSYKQ